MAFILGVSLVFGLPVQAGRIRPRAVAPDGTEPRRARRPLFAAGCIMVTGRDGFKSFSSLSFARLFPAPPPRARPPPGRPPRPAGGRCRHEASGGRSASAWAPAASPRGLRFERADRHAWSRCRAAGRPPSRGRIPFLRADPLRRSRLRRPGAGRRRRLQGKRPVSPRGGPTRQGCSGRIRPGEAEAGGWIAEGRENSGSWCQSPIGMDSDAGRDERTTCPRRPHPAPGRSDKSLDRPCFNPAFSLRSPPPLLLLLLLLLSVPLLTRAPAENEADHLPFGSISRVLGLHPRRFLSRANRYPENRVRAYPVRSECRCPGKDRRQADGRPDRAAPQPARGRSRRTLWPDDASGRGARATTPRVADRRVNWHCSCTYRPGTEAGDGSGQTVLLIRFPWRREERGRSDRAPEREPAVRSAVTSNTGR